MAAALSLDEAQARLLALATPLAVERCEVDASLGRHLAEPLVATRTQPAADISAMDGYALCGPHHASPWVVIGESAAGHPFPGQIAPGEAVRISTGALLPPGADAVLLQEDATRDGDTLHLSGDAPRPGQHIRRAGFDFRKGDALIQSGTRITPAVLALALACGHADVAVTRRPKVVIIDSGDELSSNPAACLPHQIPASNGAMLAAMAADAGCKVRRIGPVRDDQADLIAALRDAEGADLIVTSGGASVGDHDLVRPALTQWGAQIDFWKVALKPGKPIMVARRGAQLVLGLPGNPVSSFVTAYLFMLPVIRAQSGAARCLPQAMECACGTAIAAGGARVEFLRAVWDGSQVTPLKEQDSSGLNALAAANALIVRSRDAAAVDAGATVPVFLLAHGGIA